MPRTFLVLNVDSYIFFPVNVVLLCKHREEERMQAGQDPLSFFSSLVKRMNYSTVSKLSAGHLCALI